MSRRKLETDELGEAQINAAIAASAIPRTEAEEAGIDAEIDAYYVRFWQENAAFWAPFASWAKGVSKPRVRRKGDLARSRKVPNRVRSKR
jgi:hypothetical protein